MGWGGGAVGLVDSDPLSGRWVAGDCRFQPKLNQNQRGGAGGWGRGARGQGAVHTALLAMTRTPVSPQTQLLYAVCCASAPQELVSCVAVLQTHSLPHAAGNGPALRDGSFEMAALNRPQGLAYSPRRNTLYVADTENHAVRWRGGGARAVWM